MNDELTVKYLQKDKSQMGQSRKNYETVTLQRITKSWGDVLTEVLRRANNDHFSPTDVTSKLDQMKKKIELTSLSRPGRAYYEGANLIMNHSPITIDARWGKPEDFRHVEIHTHLRITYNPLQSPVIKSQLNKFRADPEKMKFTNAAIESYDGNQRLQTFKEDHYNVVCSSAREAEDAINDWAQNVWYNTKKAAKFCRQKVKDGFSIEDHFRNYCDMVSQNEIVSQQLT